MPRAFLIKKHSPGKENAGKVKHVTGIEPKDDGDSSPPLDAENMDLSTESKGPFDLSVKPKKFESDLEQEEKHKSPSPIKRVQPSVIEFSPKIVTAEYKSPHKISPVRIPAFNNGPPPSPFGKPLDGRSFHHNERSPWPMFYPMNFSYSQTPTNLYPYHRIPGPEIFPGPFLGGTSLISPPTMPLSTPRIELSPCIPSDPIFRNYDHPSNLELKLKKPEYISTWDPKEGSTSPVSLSDSGESNPESAANKYNSVVSSSTGSPVTCNQPPRYQCVDCSKSYATYSGLSRHRQFHCITQTKKAFNCKYCEKVYVSLGALKMHIRTHTLPCKCTICGKAFSRPWLLQGHIRTHTGEKPFACPHCSRAFADRSNLRAHLQTHSDVKKYSCNACSKTFSRMSLLLKHNDGGCASPPGCPDIRYGPVAIQNC